MVSLIIKIFLAYWVAAGLVIIALNIGPHSHMHKPEIRDALDASLAFTSKRLFEQYQRHECSRELTFMEEDGDAVALASNDGAILCGDVHMTGIKSTIRSAVRTRSVTVVSHVDFQEIAFPFNASDGNPYVLVLINHYKSPVQFYGNLPGSATIAISGVVTLFLAILVALPIRKLRAVASRIAEGDMSARVDVGFFARHIRFRGSGDDIDGLAADFNYMASRLQALVDAQKLLLRDVSHELRSPLARVNLALELAKSESRDQARNLLGRIEAETQRLNTLICQLMDLSYMETVQDARHREVISVSEILNGMLPDMEFEASAKGCAITTSLVEECYVQGNRDLLHRAFENVIRNAIRYSPGGGTILIEQKVGEPDYSVLVQVSDSGPGVPEEELSAILAPFYRVDRSRQSGSGGFGIGLAIADRTIQLHRGAIAIENRESGGLRVKIRMPLIESTNLQPSQEVL